MSFRALAQHLYHPFNLIDRKYREETRGNFFLSNMDRFIESSPKYLLFYRIFSNHWSQGRQRFLDIKKNHFYFTKFGTTPALRKLIAIHTNKGL